MDKTAHGSLDLKQEIQIQIQIQTFLFIERVTEMVFVFLWFVFFKKLCVNFVELYIEHFVILPERYCNMIDSV
jgi:hypothetical protein